MRRYFVILRYSPDALKRGERAAVVEVSEAVTLPEPGEGLAGFRFQGRACSAWGTIKAASPVEAWTTVERQMVAVAEGLGCTLAAPSRRQAIIVQPWWRRRRKPEMYSDGHGGRGGEDGGLAGDREPRVPSVPQGRLRVAREVPDGDFPNVVSFGHSGGGVVPAPGRRTASDERDHPGDAREEPQPRAG